MATASGDGGNGGSPAAADEALRGAVFGEGPASIRKQAEALPARVDPAVRQPDSWSEIADRLQREASVIRSAMIQAAPAWGTSAAGEGGGGGGGTAPPSSAADNGGMEQRLSAVEQSIARIDATLGGVATKAEVEGIRSEMHKGFSEMVKWIVGSAVVLGGVGITVMTFVLNNAVPKSAAAVLPPAIVINVPPTAAPAAPAPAASR